jgi:uncharacterized protein YjdB
VPFNSKASKITAVQTGLTRLFATISAQTKAGNKRLIDKFFDTFATDLIAS